MKFPEDKIDQLALDLAKDYIKALFPYMLDHDSIIHVNNNEFQNYRRDYYEEFISAYEEFADNLSKEGNEEEEN